MTAAASTAEASGNTTITSDVSVALTTPASGTVSRGEFSGFQLYSASLGAVAAYMIVQYDPNYVTDGGTAAWSLTAAYNTSTTTANFSGFTYTFPSIPNTFAGGENTYFDLGVIDDTVADTLTFTLGGTTLFSTSTPFTTFGSAVIYDARLTTGGTVGRSLIDNYSVTAGPAVAVPEPVWLGLLGTSGLMLLRRRRMAV